MSGRRITLVTTLVGTVATVALAHDMFLKPTAYLVPEYSEVPAVLLNGTFTKSENAIDRNRVAGLSIVSPGGREQIDTTDWHADGDTSRISFRVGMAGTYVLGVSTHPSEIGMGPADFNKYLRDDGLPDEMARRRRAGEWQSAAHERYAKHVKAIIQVGTARSTDFSAVLGYPAELVPLDNPYSLALGGRFRVQVLVAGRPVPNAYLLYGGTTARGGHITALATRTDPAGVGQFRVTSRGVWYVKYIHMTPLPANPEGLTHESQWSTLTFAIQ